VRRFLRRAASADAVVAPSAADAQRFLVQAAVPRTDAAAIESEVEREGAWQGEQAKIERLGDGRYRATCTHHGRFTVELAGVEPAVEAASVLGAVQRTLREALEWGMWPDDRRRRARTPGERYLRAQAKESRRASRLLLPEVRRAVRAPEGWTDEGPPGRRTIRRVSVGGRSALRVEVAEDSLVLSTHAASPDRALAFAALYAALQRDLRHILRWDPLPPAPDV
jgi:hypothetical protein